MPINPAHARELVREFDFRRLFIEELGWDQHNASLAIPIDGREVALAAVAEKRGMVAYQCPAPSGERLPDYGIRRKIEHQVAKTAHEHLIIFTDAARTTQIWQWVKREPGKPAACREHTFHKSQPGEALLQKLQAIAFSLEEEDELSLTDVTGRARIGFDVERVTKRFYERFQKEHAAFLKFITGISERTDHEWYASVMLNRLMFIYFMQRKGFLDGDSHYLRNRLKRCREEKGKDKFYSFYRYFLLRLFHEGLGGKTRTAVLDKLLGKIPYLNGGLFERHAVEERYPDIQIPDKAFERIFDYFDQYQWHLDERPLRADNEINPDVLGYIFEKYINQKQMGAYYSKEDITEYIGKTAVLPFLFETARAKCKVAFENRGGPTIWDLLREAPERYIFPALRHGVSWDIYANDGKGGPLDAPRPLPAGVVAGVKAVVRRTEWNKTAPSEYALPTEIWREVVTRRARYEDVRQQLAAGNVRDITDLITLNLDIRQFAQDVIENCEGPDLLRALWRAIENVTILDPTSGSGAFLFAALNILEALYEACLDRMEAFVADLDRSGSEHRPDKFSDFRKVIDRVGVHANRRYFIFKSIILTNLFGVDIMEEAVEICKLRLFLKLVAQVEPDTSKDNLGIEPLPDIDFNIRAGNTLIGFATYDDVKKAVTSKFDFAKSMEKISAKATELQQAFDAFRQCQTEGDGSVPTEQKLEVQKQLEALENELNRHLAVEYGADIAKKDAFEKWRKSQQPFHWFVEYYGIMEGGGFAVIIGNPPYLERREIDYEPRNYACLESGAVHAMCIERSVQLLQKNGCMSMIVPLSLPSTQRMQVVQRLLEQGRNAWYANYAWRPAKLFDTVNRALTIFVVTPAVNGRTFSTNYQKWTSDNREGLFARLAYVEVPRERPACWIPKLGEVIEEGILAKCLAVKTAVAHFTCKSEHRVYYRTDGGLYWKVFTDFPPAFVLNGKKGHSSRETWFTVNKKEHVTAVIAALSSDVFWWWYTVTSNVRHLNPFDVQNFPLPESAVADPELRELGRRYLKDIDRNSSMLVREQKQTGTTQTQSFKIQKSKPIIDEIDAVLARHYGFTAAELEFITNYDIKYRLGHEGEAE